MAASQHMIFTAIPRSVSLNPETLPVSVFISPRLRGEDKLGAYTDWLHWAERRRELELRITFECNGQTHTVDAPREQLRPELWDALFNEETLVRSHEFDDYSGRFIATYPVRWALSALKATYQAAGVALVLPSTRDEFRERHTRRQLLVSLIGAYSVNWDEAKGRKWREEQLRLQQNVGSGFGMWASRLSLTRDLFDTDGLFRTGLIEPGSEQSRQLQESVVRPFAVFGHMPPGAPLKRESLDEETVLDFHQALSSLNTYPELQRMLGLVFDIELPAEFVTMTKADIPGVLRIVQVDGNWDSGTHTTIPVTSTAYIYQSIENGDRVFAIAPRYLLNRNEPLGIFGLLNLDPARFGLAQIDVDGGLHKTITLAETVTQPIDRGPALPQHPEVFDSTTTISSLRSGGISLFADSRALSLLDTFRQSKEFNQALENSQPQPRPFCAEDLVRGYRIDIWDSRTSQWHSLHRRDSTYSIGGLEVKVEDEEGFIQLAATQAAPKEDGTRERDDLHLHEALARWDGWSLSADTPGKHLTRAADPDKAVPDPAHPDPENEPITPFNMTTAYKVVSGSLPRLRFGGSYRLRARVVDLAGNSLQLNEAVTDLLTSSLSLPQAEKAFPYLRYEPVVAPVIVLRDELGVTGKGSSVDRLVIRTFNSDPSLDGVTADLTAAERHIAPPRSTIEIGERHGMFDDRNGKLNGNASMWNLIKERDEGKFNEVKLDSIVIDGKKQFVPLEPGASIDILPYLPDPLARGAALRNLPGTKTGTFARVEPNVGSADVIQYQKLDDPNPRPGSATLIGFGGRDDWQDVVPFRLALDEGDGIPTWDPDERLLTVFLPKGQTKVVPLSCYLDTEDLKLMGVWQWLREFVEFITTRKPESEFFQRFTDKDRLAHILQLATEGGHWMLTPPHLLTLVHAVQQPIGEPRFTRLSTQLEQKSPSKLQTQPESEPTAETELALLTSWRELGSTDAYLVGGLQVHGASTAKVDIRAAWVDTIDDVNALEPREQAFIAYVDELQLNDLSEDYLLANNLDGRHVGYYDPEHDLICFARAGSRLGNLASGAAINFDTAPRHQIGDTKHHVVKYTAIATSRYREYFPQKEGSEELDFTRKSNTVTVHVPASVRPIAPQVMYVLPTFGWQRETQTNQKRSVRMGGGLRVYLDRPWYSSGIGELLGVALWPGGSDNREEWKSYITQWGQDPIWLSATLASFPSTSNFPDAIARENSLPLEAQLENGRARQVDVVGHEVYFDKDRGLWYCDLTVNTQSATYAPFVRLALIRYQPYALQEAKLSRVVLADFAQLTPERAVMVTADPYQSGRLRVVVSGPTPRGPSPQSLSEPHPATPVDRPTVIAVTVQQHDPLLQSDLAWSELPTSSYAVFVEDSNSNSKDPDLALWAGTIRFFQPLQPNQCRLLIQEREYISADYTIIAEHETGRMVEQPSRLIYAETILLDEALLNPPRPAANQTTLV